MSLINLNMESNSEPRHMERGATRKTHGNHGEHPTNVLAHSGHDRHAGHSAAMFRDKLWLSLALTIPVVICSGEVQHWLGYRAPTFPGSRLIPAILGTVILAYGGSVFIQGAFRELSGRQPGMMTLISLGMGARTRLLLVTQNGGELCFATQFRLDVSLEYRSIWTTPGS